MRGSQFYRETSPNKNSANFLGIGPHKGDKALRQIQTPFHLPRKALRNPRIQHFALKGVQSLHRTKNRPQIAPFELSAPLGHLPTCTRLAPRLAPNLPKIPRFSTFSCTQKVFLRDFSRPISRFCKIELHRERFWQKYGANFKGGQRHPCPSHRGGVVSFPFFLPRGPSFGLVSLVGLPPVGHFGRAIFRTAIFSRFKGLSGVGWWWVSSEPLKCK